jgi:CRP-like cAMP-binding protein
MEALEAYFEKLGFEASARRRIASCFTRQVLEKDACFVQEGQVSLQLAFLEQGQFQYYSMSPAGEERTTYVALPGTFMASLLSFLHELPAREHIRALTPSVIWTLPKGSLLRLQQELPGFKDFYVGLLEWQICCIDKGRFDFITLTAEQRYEKLLREEPEMVRQVPLQYIASMLGISPRHLSRLRAKF